MEEIEIKYIKIRDSEGVSEYKIDNTGCCFKHLMPRSVRNMLTDYCIEQLNTMESDNIEVLKIKSLQATIDEMKDIIKEGCQELRYLENYFYEDHIDAEKAREFLTKIITKHPEIFKEG